MTTQRAITDDLELLLEIMPAHVREAVEAAPDRQDLLEVVLDLGRVPEARFPDRVFEIGERPVSRAELSAVVERVGRFGADNRAGIERTLHRISAIRNREGVAIGLTCRVGRAVIGTVDILRDVIEDGRSILLLGRPGVGKTTLLREAARVLADDLGKRVVVVDTSNEIAGDGDIPHPGIGRARRMQVPSPDRQHAVMIEAVENHMPEVIVIDEIGTGAEALAARTIAERGVQLIATAHGNDLDNLLQNPTLSDLVGGIHAVTLSDEEARRRRTQKTVLERKAPPTFDVVVEIQERDRLAVHHEIALVVDRHLRGEPLRPERRVRTDEGEVEIREPVPDAPQPAGTDTLRPERKILKIFPYAISKEKLLQAIETLDVPAYLVEDFSMADVLLTVKAQDRRQPRKLRDARERGVRIEVVRSNSVGQLEKYLRRHFGVGRTVDPHTVPDDEGEVREAFAEDYEAALQETEGGIDQVLDRGHPVELSPQDRPIRRLQHEMVERAGLVTRSKGTDPYRRVVIYPR